MSLLIDKSSIMKGLDLNCTFLHAIRYLLFLSLNGIACHLVYAQNCPNMATFCEDVPLTCGANNLNNSSCTLEASNNYQGDRCNELCTGSAQNQTHYAFVSNGSKIDIIVTVNNCSNAWGYNPGLDFGMSTSCCGGEKIACKRSPQPIPPNYQLKITIASPIPCKIYYMDLDGYEGSVCDYTINITGGNAPQPLILKNINNDANNIIEMSQGACSQKFKVDPLNEPCEGYFEWTLDGQALNDFDREVRLDFPNEGDFVLCVQGYIGVPNYNCGQSNLTCTTIKVKKDQLYGNTRILCNEQRGFKWHQQKINSSGVYTQGFNTACHIFDSIVEFILLPKPESGRINYVSCTRSDPYFDPIQKNYYRNCTANQKIPIPKSTEIYACDSSYILNVAYVDLKTNFHLTCKNGNVFMVPEIVNYTDTCGIGIEMKYSYSWFEKTNNNPIFIGSSQELKIIKKGNYQLLVLVQYSFGSESGICNFTFDEEIDEDSYLTSPNTGSLLGKNEVCKGDIECYAIKDIVKDPFSFNWNVVEGDIITTNPDLKDSICVRWHKNSSMAGGKICVSYSDSCSSSLQACLDIAFGRSEKNIAGPDQELGGVLGTKLNAQGKKGLWSYAGGPGTAHFADPTDPKTRVRVSRFGAYTFKWTTIEDGCEIYGFLTINFYIEFPQLQGEYLPPFKGYGLTGPSVDLFQSHYLNRQLNIKFSAEIKQSIRYQIINIQGQLIDVGTISQNLNESSIYVNIDLKPGIYFLNIESGNLNRVSRFVVFD